MFDDLIRAMEDLDGASISVPIEPDEKGYVDKQCPNEKCLFLFKVNEEDWSETLEDKAVWCPMCRHEAPSDEWFTLDQIEHAKAEAMNQVQGVVNRALKTGAQKFNRSQRRNSWIKLSMSVSGDSSRSYMIPAQAAEEMQLEIQCEECAARFAVVGSAYFCPACGHNSVENTFGDSLRKISAKTKSLGAVRKAIEDTAGKDEAELTCRSLIETSISDAVVAFQKFCEGVYAPYGSPPSNNAFQRIEQGSALWQDAIGVTYEQVLGATDLGELVRLFQSRHLLAHNEGIVDQQYLDRSGDSNYRVGQRLVINISDVEAIVRIVSQLADGLRQGIGSAQQADPADGA